MAEELVAESFAFAGSLDDPGDVDQVESAVGTSFLGTMYLLILASRSSGTLTTPSFGSMVQNG